MPFVDDILRRGSVSIVGLAKNAGKTEVLNYVLRRIGAMPDRDGERVATRVAVTSIGLDGEATDQITRGAKPAIELPEGVVFVTTETHYRQKRLVAMLRPYHPVWVTPHFNHTDEITAESVAACEMLLDAGIPLGNQSVLLRGVNDSVETMKALVTNLIRIRVRPYYLYQCDLSVGIEHFRTPVSKGIEIIENLRGHVSGLAVPTFVVDAPGGGGKIPVMPTYLISQSPHKVVLRNYEGRITTYTEPDDY
jgi:L-lysine 2,3-aminomutase